MRLITLFLLFSISCFSQSFWKDYSNNCGIDHKCKAQVHLDEFEGSKIITSGKTTYFGNKYTTKSCKVSVQKFISQENNMFVVSLTAVSGSGCTARDRSNIIFILDNEEVLKINSIDKIDCGTPEISVRLTEEEMKILSENTVKKVRMNFTDSQYDFVVSENEKPKFIEQLNCILNIK